MSGSVTPNRLLGVTRFLKIPDKYAPGVYARAFEAFKFFTSTASVSDAKWIKGSLGHVFTGMSIIATGLMTAFYGNKGVQWLGLQNSGDAEHGQLSGTGKAATLWGVFGARDAVTNSGNILNVFSTIATAMSRAKAIAGDPNAIAEGEAKPKLASESLSGLGIVLTGLMAALETPLADRVLFTRPARDATTGGGMGFQNPVPAEAH